MDGESTLISEKKITNASLTFVDGLEMVFVISVMRMALFFNGDMANSYHQGRGREYDEKGK